MFARALYLAEPGLMPRHLIPCGVWAMWDNHACPQPQLRGLFPPYVDPFEGLILWGVSGGEYPPMPSITSERTAYPML